MTKYLYHLCVIYLSLSVLALPYFSINRYVNILGLFLILITILTEFNKFSKPLKIVYKKYRTLLPYVTLVLIWTAMAHRTIKYLSFRYFLMILLAFTFSLILTKIRKHMLFAKVYVYSVSSVTLYTLVMFFSFSIKVIGDEESRLRVGIIDNFDTAGLNSNSFGIYSNLAIILIIYLFIKSQSIVLKTSWLFLLFSNILLISYVLGSRQNIIMMSVSIISSFFYIFDRNISKFGKMLTFIVLVMCSLIGLMWAVQSIFYERIVRLVYQFTENLKFEGSANARYLMIKDGISIWLQNPIVGSGSLAFQRLSGWGTYSHNQYIELLTSYGLIGFFSYISFYINIIHIKIKYTYFTLEHKLLIISIISLCVSHMFKPILTDKIIFMYLGYLVAVNINIQSKKYFRIE